MENLSWRHLQIQSLDNKHFVIFYKLQSSDLFSVAFIVLQSSNIQCHCWLKSFVKPSAASPVSYSTKLPF